MAPVRTRKKGSKPLDSSPYKRNTGVILRQRPTLPSLKPFVPALLTIPAVSAAGKVGIPLEKFLASFSISSVEKICIPSAEKTPTPSAEKDTTSPRRLVATAPTSAHKYKYVPAEISPTTEKVTPQPQGTPTSTSSVVAISSPPAAANEAITTCIAARVGRKPVAAQYTFNESPALFSRGWGRARKNVGGPIPFKLCQRPPDNGGMRLREDPVKLKGTLFNGGMFAGFLKESAEREKENEARESDQRGSPMKLDSPMKEDSPMTVYSPMKLDMTMQVDMPVHIDVSVHEIFNAPLDSPKSPYVKPKLPQLFQKLIPTLTADQSGSKMSNVNSKLSPADANHEEESDDGEDFNQISRMDAHTHVGQMPWIANHTYVMTATRGAVPVSSHVPSLLAAIERGKAMLDLENPLPVPQGAGCTATPNCRQSLAYNAVVEFLTPKAETKDATPMIEKKDEFAASPAFNLTQRSVTERRLGPIKGAVQESGERSRVRVVTTVDGVNVVERYGVKMRKL
ncbi:hypothetical protein P167DRAFT_545555 [Morchella conica CCBAS932]|uniref:Uncharacterized protein n=1 Tax=Morchella conica CCBAS932 TaxID=1392247 RepID=A0A3N4KS35_9PEZI|nr:hypothetical protein P167DRAFT_545555 [Morchella conica CCBAS932]